MTAREPAARYGRIDAGDGRMMEFCLFGGRGGRGNIVAIQGAMMGMDVWEKQMPLTDEYNLLCFRGSGFDEDNARQVLKLCMGFDFVLPHVIGHSMGAYTSREFCRLASREPGFGPQTLTLVTPVGHEWKGIGRLTRLMVFVQKMGMQSWDDNLVSFIRHRSGFPANARLELCDDHFPFQTNPEWFNTLYRDFIREQR